MAQFTRYVSERLLMMLLRAAKEYNNHVDSTIRVTIEIDDDRLTDLAAKEK